MASFLDTITSAVKKAKVKTAEFLGDVKKEVVGVKENLPTAKKNIVAGFTQPITDTKEVISGVSRAFGTEEGRKDIEESFRSTLDTVIKKTKETGGDTPGFIDVAAGIGKTFTQAQEEYQAQPKENKSRILDVIGGIGQAPVSIGSGYAGAIDTSKSKVERGASASDAVLGLVGLVPGVAQAQGIYNFVVPQTAKEGVSSGITRFSKDVLIPEIKKFGADDKDAEAISRITWNAANVLAGLFGGKAGSYTKGKVTPKFGATIGTVADKVIDTTVQSSPDLFAMAYNAYKEGGESKAGDILLTAIANNAVAFPGLKAMKTKLADNQLKLDTEVPAKSEAPTAAIPKETPVAPVKEVTPPIAKSETAPVLSKNPETIMVKDIVEGLSKTKEGETFRIDIPGGTEFINKGGKAEYSDFGVIRTDDDVITGVKEVPTFTETIAKAEPEPAVTAIKKAKKISKKGELLPETIVTSEQTSPTKTITDIVNEATRTKEGKVTPPELDFKETKYKNVKNVDKSIDLARKQSEGDYTPEFKVGDITQALPTITGVLARNFNLSRFLDNIRVKVGEKFVPVGGYMEGAMRSMRENIKNSIVGQFKSNLKNVDGTLKAGVEKTDLLGTKTTQGIEVTKDNVDTFLKSYDNIDYYDKKLPGLTQKETNDLVKASYIYDLVKQKGPETLSKYFTPDQIKAFQALENIEKDIYGATSKKASDDQVYEGELNPDYIHFDMIRKNFERLPKAEQQSVTVNIDGENVKFDNYLDAIDALDRAKRLGKKIDTDTFVGLEQKKSSNIIDPMRTHGALGRLLSYADGMGKAYSDKKVVNIFNDLQKTGIDKNTSQRIQDYLGWLNARGIKNPAEQMLAYSDTSLGAKVAQGLSSIGSQAAITFNPKTYVQGVLSAGLKNTVDALGSFGQNLLSLEPKAALYDIGSAVTGLAKTIANTALALGKKEIGQMTRAQKITDTLVRDGFITGLEIGDRNLGTAFEVSSGLVQENAAKADVALRGMRRALLSNGFTDVYTPEGIAKSWDRFRSEKINEYIQAREQIRQDTRLIADVSRQSRLTTVGLFNTAGALKTYMLGVINQSAQDASTLANYITNKVSKDILVERPEAINSIRRLALVYGAYMAAEKLVEEGLEAQGYIYEELSEEGKKLYDSIKKNYAKRIASTPESMLNELVGGLVSNVGLSKAYTLFNDIGQAVVELGESNNDKRYKELGLDILNAGARFFAAGNAVNEAYSLYSPDNETGLDTLSASAGLPGRSGQTRYGLATGQNNDSKVESFMNMLGFKQDQAVLDHLYGLKSDLELQSDIPDPIKRAAVVWLKSQGQRIAQSNFPIVSDIAAQLSGSEKNIDWQGGVKNRIKAQYSHEAADRLMNGEAKTLTEFLTLNGIDPQWKQFINQAINNRVQTIMGKSPSVNKQTGELTEGSGNEQVEWTINNFLNPRIWAKDDRGVLDNWKDMQKKNPKLFNDTMAFIGGLALAEDERRMNGVELNLDYIKKIGKDGKLEPNDPLASQVFDKDAKTIADSTAQDDKAIADILGTPALKTSFTEAVADTLGKYGDYIKKEGKEGALKRLDRLETLTKTIMENTQFTNGYINSLSLMNFETKSALRNLAKMGLTAEVIQNRFPALYDSLLNALSLRGEGTDKEGGKTLSSIVQKTGTGSGKGYTPGISLPETTGIIPDKKQKKFELPSGGKAPSLKSVGAQKSLAELLSTPQMRQAISAGQRLQTREPLATFSKSLQK